MKKAIDTRISALWECYEIAENERIRWDDEQSDLAYERAHEAECIRDLIKHIIAGGAL